MNPLNRGPSPDGYGYAQVLEEKSTVGGTPTMSYVIGNEVLAQCSGLTTTAPSYFLQDGHGNKRQMAQMDGSVFKHYTYDVYGNVQANISSSTAEYSATYNNGVPNITTKLYCGEQYDSNLQMYNLRARYYDPATGQFNQRDTFAGINDDPQSLHKYLYAGADPINNADPSGLQFSMVEILMVAGIVGIVAGLCTFAITGSVKAAIYVGVLAFVITALAMLAIVYWGQIIQFLQQAVRFITSNLSRAWSALRTGFNILKQNVQKMIKKAADAIQKGFVIYVQLPTGYSKTPARRIPPLNKLNKAGKKVPFGIEIGGRPGRLIGFRLYPRVGVNPNAFNNINTILRIDYIDYRLSPPAFGLHLHILDWEYNFDEHLPITTLFKNLFP